MLWRIRGRGTLEITSKPSTKILFGNRAFGG